MLSVVMDWRQSIKYRWFTLIEISSPSKTASMLQTLSPTAEIFYSISKLFAFGKSLSVSWLKISEKIKIVYNPGRRIRWCARQDKCFVTLNPFDVPPRKSRSLRRPYQKSLLSPWHFSEE